MTNETNTLPDTVIQEWPEELQRALLAKFQETLAKSHYLGEYQPVNYDDIAACGSRVLGCFEPNSDIDAVVWIRNYTPPIVVGRENFAFRIDGEFEGVKFNLWLRSAETKSLAVFRGHPDAPSSEGWRMPHYSLVTRTLYPLFEPDIADFLRFRHTLNPQWYAKSKRRWDKLIVPINLPFQTPTAL